MAMGKKELLSLSLTLIFINNSFCLFTLSSYPLLVVESTRSIHLIATAAVEGM